MREVLRKLQRNILWQLYSRLPKNPKKAVCQSFYGRGWSDSPGAIGAELLSRGYEVYWMVKGEREAASLPTGAKPLLLESTEAIYHQCTAGVWVDNCRKWAYTQKGRQQLYLQTWHGFPLKRIEGDAEDALPPDYLKAAKHDSQLCDLFLSNSRFLTEVYRNAFWFSGEILEMGLPRNDCLTKPDPEIREKVRKKLGVAPEKKLLLYAPTFRKDKGTSAYDVNFPLCVAALSKKFGGEWEVLLKLHPNIAEKASDMGTDPEIVKNASHYPDIQELYLTCDALLTDYSSVMFDFMATQKPCFLYVNDKEAYREDRNFYFDLEKLPYPLAETNDALEQAILTFNPNSQKEKEEAFRKEFGLRETGQAAAAAVDWIQQKQKKEGKHP